MATVGPCRVFFGRFFVSVTILYTTFSHMSTIWGEKLASCRAKVASQGVFGGRRYKIDGNTLFLSENGAKNEHFDVKMGWNLLFWRQFLWWILDDGALNCRRTGSMMVCGVVAVGRILRGLIFGSRELE